MQADTVQPIRIPNKEEKVKLCIHGQTPAGPQGRRQAVQTSLLTEGQLHSRQTERER